jgi:hypothetical protein
MLNWRGWAANWLGWGSAGPVTPPVAGGGGDRGINLLRGPFFEEERVEQKPKPVTVRIRTRQPAQQGLLTVTAETAIRLASWGYGADVLAKFETETSIRFATEQKHSIDVRFDVGRVQTKMIPVRPQFTARLSIETETKNEAKLTVE